MARKQETKTTTKKKTPAKRTTKKAVAEVKAPEVTVEEPKAEAVEEVKEEPKAEAVEEVKEEPKAEAAEEVKEEPTAEAAEEVKEEPKAEAAEEVKEEPKAEEVKEEPKAEAVKEEPKAEAVEEVKEEPKAEAVKEEVVEEPKYEAPPTSRRSVAFIGSECYPFVKTGGLGDVMYALPKALVKQNCDVKVIIPRYKCIPWKYQEKMVYRGSFQMNLCEDGRSFYVGIMEYVWDGVVYDFIDNEEFFSDGNPYTNLIDDIPKYCYFAKAALAALNYMNWVPDIIHCHDWQAALVPVYLRTLFENTKLTSAKTILTIHNLRL